LKARLRRFLRKVPLRDTPSDQDSSPDLQKSPRPANFSYENSCIRLFNSGCELGGSTSSDDSHPAAACDVHLDDDTSAGDQFGRSESGGDEPNHQPAQPAAVPTQCGRGSKCASAHHIRSAKDNDQTCQIVRSSDGEIEKSLRLARLYPKSCHVVGR
jgi:hypothetical protein